MLAFTSSYYMPNNHVKASVLYIACSLLDEVDGYLARLLDQGRDSAIMLTTSSCMVFRISFSTPNIWANIWQKVPYGYN